MKLVVQQRIANAKSWKKLGAEVLMSNIWVTPQPLQNSKLMRMPRASQHHLWDSENTLIQHDSTKFQCNQQSSMAFLTSNTLRTLTLVGALWLWSSLASCGANVDINISRHHTVLVYAIVTYVLQVPERSSRSYSQKWQQPHISSTENATQAGPVPELWTYKLDSLLLGFFFTLFPTSFDLRASRGGRKVV